MIIGNFIHNSNIDTYSGEIMSLTIYLTSVIIRPNDKESYKEPDYRVLQQFNDDEVELGAAWKRTSDRGRDFLSITLDDPTLPAALSAALFHSDEGERATLVWQRQNRRSPTTKTTPAKPRRAPNTRASSLTLWQTRRCVALMRLGVPSASRSARRQDAIPGDS